MSGLSDIQRSAVMAIQGPSLVIAGAGSGKTRVLTYRIAYLLEQGVRPWQILALTFTNKAAREMIERIGAVVGTQTAGQLWMGTFHAMCVRILRQEGHRLGFDRNFTIYDTADTKTLIRRIVKELQLDTQVYKDSEIYDRISRAKNSLVTPQAYANNSALVMEDNKNRRSEIHRIYAIYSQRCHRASALDFDDLLLNVNILFRDFPEVLDKYQKKFQYIMVDEYQDTNYSQYLIVKKLGEIHHNVCVVGDDGQSIYSFRGAKIENILNFRNDYPDYQLFKLEQNYRSTQTIVNAANSIIDHNKNQIKKISFSSNAVGERLKLLTAFTDAEEATLVSNSIADTVEETHCRYSDFAILYRTNAQSRNFEEKLRNQNIPYRVYGGLSFYQRKEIKDMLAYLRLTVNLNDDESLVRIINVPARGIGDTTLERLQAIANQTHTSIWTAIVNLSHNATGDLRASTIKKILNFAHIIDENRVRALNQDAYEVAYAIAKKSGMIGELKLDKSLEAKVRLQNIEELLNSIKLFVEEQKQLNDTPVVTLAEYLENVALLTDMDTDKPDDQNRVRLMTVHSSKGLEFDYVYLPGMEETLFPSNMGGLTQKDLEEERRLFYVAVTRAAKRVTMLHARSRMRWGKLTRNAPSRFLSEIDPQYIDTNSLNTTAQTTFATETTQTTHTDQTHCIRPNGPTLRSLGKPQIAPIRHIETTEDMLNADSMEITNGMAVFHDRFGWGQVIEIEGKGPNKTAQIKFEKAGTKKLLLRYANLKTR